MPYSVSNANTNLREIISRNDAARQIIAGFSADMPTLSEVWRHLQAALADTLVLVTEVTKLSDELKETRHDLANLLAAIRATLAAHSDGEAEPLWYIRDELAAQGALGPTPRRRA
ncbi:MAG: hypothetical protein JO345_22920 [Streptosporangiaceae bacterium]|nr:hypothetical protein [Streptosporangiaceae bacterium]